MKLSDLHRTGRKKQRNDGSDDDDDESSDEEELDETDDDPTLDHINIPHRGGVNRVRSMPQRPGIVATWSETSDVHVWDLEEQVSALAAKGAPRKSKVDPAFTFDGHMEASGFFFLFDSRGQECSPDILLSEPLVCDASGTACLLLLSRSSVAQQWQYVNDWRTASFAFRSCFMRCSHLWCRLSSTGLHSPTRLPLVPTTVLFSPLSLPPASRVRVVRFVSFFRRGSRWTGRRQRKGG